MLPGKQISISGVRVVAFLSKESPLSCLLMDGRFFGDDYQEKTAPSLPHEKGCQCMLMENIRRSREMGAKQSNDSFSQMSDLGELNPSDARFYRFFLISLHPDASDSLKSEYQELAANVDVNDRFRRQVETHLRAPIEETYNNNQP